MAFQALELALDAIHHLVTPLADIAQRDPDLARQIRRAAASMALNLGEGAPEAGTRPHAPLARRRRKRRRGRDRAARRGKLPDRSRNLRSHLDSGDSVDRARCFNYLLDISAICRRGRDARTPGANRPPRFQRQCLQRLSLRDLLLSLSIQ